MSEETPKEQEKEKVAALIEGTEEVQVKVVDPKDALYSVQSFEELHLNAELLKGVYAMGYQRPSKIQGRALPLLMATPHRNFIGQSQSGTGKTAAFVLAVLSRVDINVKDVQAVVIAPTRELANQILDVVKKMAQFTGITSGQALKDSIERGGSLTDQVVVGTPGTLQDLLRRQAINPANVKMFVVDEADMMLDRQGMGDQTIRIRKLLPQEAQAVLFSATYKDEVRQFAERVIPNANMISLKREELSVDAIKQVWLHCTNSEHRYQVLCDIYGLCNIGQSIIFCARRDTADRIAARMAGDGHQITVIHGGLDASERDRIFNMYRTGETKVLITTNVMARGIDVLDVNLVINYDLPDNGRGRPDFETYLHRIGRTGRFGRTGISINFVHDETSLRINDEIQKYFGKPITRVGTSDIGQLEKELKEALKR